MHAENFIQYRQTSGNSCVGVKCFKLLNSSDCLQLVLPFQRDVSAVDEGKFCFRVCGVKLMISNMLEKKRRYGLSTQRNDSNYACEVLLVSSAKDFFFRDEPIGIRQGDINRKNSTFDKMSAEVKDHLY